MAAPINSQEPHVPIKQYPTDLGAFTALPDDIIARVLSFTWPLEIAYPRQPFEPLRLTGPAPWICKDFARISRDPLIIYLYLESERSELKKRTELGFKDIQSLTERFKIKCARDLPLSKIFANCPQLTMLDLSDSPINNSELEEIIKAAAPHCKIECLFLSRCNNITALPSNLSELKSLKDLVLNGTALKGQLDFFGLSKLKALRLEAPQMTAVNFKGLDSLQKLQLWGCRGLTIETLNLDGLDKLRFLNLTKCTGLIGELNLRDMKLTYLFLKHCRGLTGLSHINLNLLESLNLHGAPILKQRLDLRGMEECWHGYYKRS